MSPCQVVSVLVYVALISGIFVVVDSKALMPNSIAAAAAAAASSLSSSPGVVLGAASPSNVAAAVAAAKSLTPSSRRVASLFRQSLFQAFVEAQSQGDWFRNLELLGRDNFVEDFMSIQDPRQGSEAGALLAETTDSLREAEIAAQVENVFAKEKKFASTRLGQKMKRKLAKMLAKRTNCPVVYEWQDLGEHHFPRYIRTGSCSQKRSCSFPSGMGCKPAEQSHLTLLRRFCGARRWGKAEVEPFNHDATCRWISIKYPIVTKCSCSC